jgi:hypothetical protein
LIATLNVMSPVFAICLLGFASPSDASAMFRTAES